MYMNCTSIWVYKTVLEVFYVKDFGVWKKKVEGLKNNGVHVVS